MKSLLLQIAKLESNYKLQLLESEYQKQSPGSALWKRCSKHFGKFTEKHQCQSLFLNKVEGCKLACTCTVEGCKLAHVFSYGFCETFSNTFFIENIGWLLFE